MKVAIMAAETTDVTPLLISCTWSGSRTQAARRLQFTFVQDDRDPRIPAVDVECGYTVVGGDDDGNIVFRGNVYNVERDRAAGTVKVLAYDNMFILSRSKLYRKYTDARPENIAAEVCEALGVKVGSLAQTGTPVSFIANGRTGYQIIMAAYTEAKKKTGTIYCALMNGDALDVVEAGELCGVTLNAAANMTGSEYHESIENLINAVQITDEAGNVGELVADDASIEKYSLFLETLRTQTNKDMRAEALAILDKNKVERSGVVSAIGDYLAVSGKSLVVKDSLFTGKFFIESDTHTFSDGVHEMRLNLSFEALMLEIELPGG